MATVKQMRKDIEHNSGYDCNCDNESGANTKPKKFCSVVSCWPIFCLIIVVRNAFSSKFLFWCLNGL